MKVTCPLFVTIVDLYWEVRFEVINTKVSFVKTNKNIDKHVCACKYGVVHTCIFSQWGNLIIFLLQCWPFLPCHQQSTIQLRPLQIYKKLSEEINKRIIQNIILLYYILLYFIEFQSLKTAAIFKLYNIFYCIYCIILDQRQVHFDQSYTNVYVSGGKKLKSLLIILMSIICPWYTGMLSSKIIHTKISQILGLYMNWEKSRSVGRLKSWWNNWGHLYLFPLQNIILETQGN